MGRDGDETESRSLPVKITRRHDMIALRVRVGGWS
jgi:hypothetical protein